MKPVSNKSPTHQSKETLALFDFDHTILNKDSSGEFIRFAFEQRPGQRLLLKLAKPLLIALSVSKRTHWRRNWMYYQIAVSGLDEKGIDQLYDGYVRHLFESKNAKVYDEAIERLTYHQSQGHRVVIISGSLQWLLIRLCDHLDIKDVEILGSDKTFFCYAGNKPVRLHQLNLLDSHEIVYGYSDSAADIPMLSLCDHKFLVNPNPDCLEKFTQSFGNSAKVLKWQ